MNAQDYDALPIDEKERIITSAGFHPWYATLFVNHDDPSLRLPRHIVLRAITGIPLDSASILRELDELPYTPEVVYNNYYRIDAIWVHGCYNTKPFPQQTVPEEDDNAEMIHHFVMLPELLEGKVIA